MIHVTYVIHGLHKVAEKVRNTFYVVDKVISSIKSVFRKAPSRLLVFKTEASNLMLPPEPILTRWRSWINASIYYYENFGILHRVLFMLDRNDANSIKYTQDYIIKPGLEYHFTNIKSNFAKLTTAIEKLQKPYVFWNSMWSKWKICSKEVQSDTRKKWWFLDVNKNIKSSNWWRNIRIFRMI